MPAASIGVTKRRMRSDGQDRHAGGVVGVGEDE